MILQGIRRAVLPALILLAGSGASGVAERAPLPSRAAAAQEKQDKDEKRPSLSLKASPNVSFSPSRISLVAELKGGPDDSAEFYCPTIEWNWGDGTTSQATTDCDPYEAGKTEIQRRFTAQRLYRTAGSYRVQIVLKRQDRVLATASASIQVRGGLRDSFGS